MAADHFPRNPAGAAPELREPRRRQIRFLTINFFALT
jgi:hypothetical protein